MSLNPREQSSLVRIGDLALDAQDLSRMTYGAVPVDDQGAGARWLRSVALAYLNDRGDMLAGDAAKAGSSATRPTDKENLA